MKLLMLLLLLISMPSKVLAAHSAQDYASVETSREKQIEGLRNEEIHAVKMALSLRSPENRKAELYLRLAELYLEAYRADFLLEGRLQEKALTRNPNATLDKERSLNDLKFGIGAAEEILKMKVDETKLDKVYYFLGYNYGELGYTKKSLEYYKKLSTDFPDSPFAVEGLRASADESFQTGKFAEARAAYEQALTKTQDASQKARIYHKVAWCYYREKRTNDAIEAMKKAIEFAQQDKEKSFNVREEGLRDLAVYYAESGRVDEAIDYFKRNAGGEEKLAGVLEKLGKEYERTGQTEKAKQVYGVLLHLDHKDESSFRVAAKMFDLDLLSQNFDSAYERLKALPIPKSKDPDTNIAIMNLRKTVRSTGVNNHERYRRMDDKQEGRVYLLAAEKFYSIYLAKFLPQDEASRAERNEIRMYLAEVKRETGQPGAAANLYKLIIQDQDPKFSKEAAQLWVGSLAQELKKKSESGEKPGDSPSQVEQDFVAASDLLEKSIPDSVESREARLRSAQILAAYPSEKQNAVARASKLAKDASNTPQGVLAARLWLQLVPDKTTYDSVSMNLGLVEADKSGKGDLAKDLAALKQKLRVGEISTLEKNKNYVEAAKGYEEFARSAKTEKDADNAYLGALNAYAQNGSSDEVARVMREWKTKYPKSAVVEKSVKSQATQFFIRGIFTDSAELFLGIGRQFKDLASYLTSAALFDGGLQHQKAREVDRMALALAPNDEERAKIYKSSAMIAQDIKDDLGSMEDWKSCYALNTSLKAECGAQIGNYYLRLNDLHAGQNIFEEVVKIKKGPSSKSPYIAYAQFRIAQILEKGMKNTPLQFPDTQLLQAFTSRVEELKPVSNAYQKAIELGGPWGIAATERLGDLALGLSSEVETVLKDPKATANLKQALIPVSEALKKKALDNSKSAYAIALKQEILSPALPVIQDRLVEAGVVLGSSAMNHAQGPRLGIKLIGMSPDGGKAGATDAMKQVRDHLLQNQDDALGWIDYGNLLWGIGKPGLSKVAYQRSLEIKTRTADALNNLAVVLVSDQGFENWFAANESVALWKRALTHETTNSAALFNLGHYFNYFRLFELAQSYFERASHKVTIAEVHDGLGIAEYGLGQNTDGELELKKSEELGLKSDRFVRKYIEAGMSKTNAECLTRLSQIAGVNDLKGFEKISYERMKMRCQQ